MTVKNAFQMLRFNEKKYFDRGCLRLQLPLKNVLCCLLDNRVNEIRASRKGRVDRYPAGALYPWRDALISFRYISMHT